MVLLDATGETHVLSDDVAGLGDPAWTPDGEHVMWTQYKLQGRENSLILADSSGTLINGYDIGYRVEGFFWEVCD